MFALMPADLELTQPTPAAIRAERLAAGLTQEQAAALVHAPSYRTWQNWEADPGSAEAREMPLAAWDLFLLKVGRRRLVVVKGTRT